MSFTNGNPSYISNSCLLLFWSLENAFIIINAKYGLGVLVSLIVPHRFVNVPEVEESFNESSPAAVVEFQEDMDNRRKSVMDSILGADAETRQYGFIEVFKQEVLTAFAIMDFTF